MAGDRPTPPGTTGTPDTDALIARLAAGARPVRRLRPPRERLLVWLALELAVLAAAALAFGTRPDLAAKLAQASFAGEILLLLAVGLGSGTLALLAAVPGREPARAAVLGALAVVLLVLGASFAAEPTLGHGLHEWATIGWLCAVRTVAVAAVPWLALLLAARRGATLVPGLVGLLSAGAALLLAAITVRIACPLDERWHLLGFHLGPVVLGAALSAALGLAWLSRWRRRL